MKYLLMMCIDPSASPRSDSVSPGHCLCPSLSVRHQTLSFPLPPAAADALSPENIIAGKTFTLDKKAGRCQQNPNLYRRSGRPPVRPGRAERQIQQTKHRSTLYSPDSQVVNPGIGAWSVERGHFGISLMNTKTPYFCVKMAEKNEVKDASPPYKIAYPFFLGGSNL